MTGDMRASGTRSPDDILRITINTILSQKSHPSFHVRETVMLSAFILMTKNYSCLSEDELKMVKTLFVDGIHDVKPEGEEHVVCGTLLSS